MDRLHGILVFLNVVETRNLSETARSLGVSPAAVSAAIMRLERKLSVRLLNRTTRLVTTTPEGAEFYQRCKQIVADLEQAENNVSRSAGAPSGRLRVGMPAALGKMWFIPHLKQFCDAYPGISVEVALNDFISRSNQSSLDAAIQVGELPTSRMTARKLCSVEYAVCASPNYLRARGVPEDPGALVGHACLTYRRPRNGQIRKWRFAHGSAIDSIAIDGAVTFNSGEALVCAATNGLGVIQVARYYATPYLASGELVELLRDFRAPAHDVYVIFQQRRRMTSRLRVFVDFLIKIFESPDWALNSLPCGKG